MAQPRGRGRPPFNATKEARLKVTRLAAGGVTHDDIARVLGISRPTLYKHLTEELTTGAAIVRTAAIDKLRELGMKGNVPALDKWLRRGDVVAAMSVDDRKATKLGKKQIEALEAQNAEQGTGWASVVRH